MSRRKDVVTNVGMSREDLEALAIDVVCARLYYDLVDTIQETPDDDLCKVIEENNFKKCSC